MDSTPGACRPAAAGSRLAGHAGDCNSIHVGADARSLILTSGGYAVNYLPLLSTIITFIFAAAVLARWRYKKPRHLLLWGIGLIFSRVRELLALYF